MKFKILIFQFIFCTALFAQEKADAPKYGWQREMVGGINLTQTSFDNWAQGGENQAAWQMNLNFKFVNDQEKNNWANTGKFSYGSTKSGDDPAKKSIDEIKLESVYTHKLHVYINPYVAGTAETQFAPGYMYSDESKSQISAFLDPGYFRESFGVGISKSELIKTRLGAAMKQTITSDYPSPYADDKKTLDKIEKIKNEFGAESVTDLNWKITETSLLTSKLELFSNLDSFDEIDVNWDNIFTSKISKYFNVNFNLKLFYDKDISPKRQLQQAIALGLTYTFL